MSKVGSIRHKLFILIVILSNIGFACIGQHRAFAFQDAASQNISVQHLDSVYKMAVNVADTTQGVFQTEAEQEQLYNAYVTLLKDFNKFLKANDFRWEKPTRCFNRIYFKKDGTIDYFLYNFNIGNKPVDLISMERQTEFHRLLNLYIQDAKIAMTANVNFVQCSPATYMSKE